MKARLFSITLAAALLIVFCASSAPAAPKFKLVYYDGHTHTYRSDGQGSVAQIKEMAQSRGLSAVIITDHCWMLSREEWASMVAECQAASNATFLALPGFEVTGSDGIFNRTHVNALGVADPFVGNDSDCLCPEEVWESPENPSGTGAVYPENIRKWVDYIHSQGGIAVHNHPSGTTSLDYGVNNIEVYNQGHVDDVMGYALGFGYPPEYAWFLGITMNDFAIYGERDVNMLVPFPPYGDVPLRIALWYATQSSNLGGIGQWLGTPQAPWLFGPTVPLNSWDQLLLAYIDGFVDEPIFGLANSDAHNTDDLDCTDGSCSKVGVAKNGAYVKNLTAKELYKAIKSGKTFATTGPSLYLDVNGDLMGDTAYISEGGTAKIKLRANSESSSALLVKIDIIKNGTLWQTKTPDSPTYAVTLGDVVSEDGYYRVEVTSLGPDGYQFAWSNPVFVRVQ